MKKVNAQEIAKFLNSEFYGVNITLDRACSLDNAQDGVLIFSKSSKNLDIQKKCLVLVPLDFEYLKESVYSVIKVENPRLAFAKVVNNFFIDNFCSGIAISTKLGKNCIIDESVSIGENCVIGNNVIIKKRTKINHNVVISDNVTVGEKCYIKSGSVIGEDGFGFDFEKDGTPIRIPHIGTVNIGNNVEIGSNTVIVRGTLNNTIIEDNVKIDDQVFIAHNSKIGRNTVVIAFAEISGSVTIGQNCWIGPNCSIIQKVKIGNNVTIGIGSVITSDIEDNKKIMGLEGLDLRNLLKVKKRIEYGK
ncbi:MAG: UDP-3-O-(3-hydroxymyristoyl)glucosamine N-acyltransferase [Sulfurospirillum sp.]|nr:UDP-3-O-(3-hydroxymyristoyl)glucosamine N-acyltransferase [Sulfurospirillum sp.]